MTTEATAARYQPIVGALIRGIDAINDRVGRWSAWLALLLVAIVTYDVVMRYLFNTTFVFIQELEWHIFAVDAN